ncbi:MAG: response regulator [Thermoanaerobaculia bacterium]
MRAADQKKILVVDDEVDLLTSLAELLEDEGYQVETAADGREALSRLARRPLPSVVILDLIMPVLSGVEVYARIREDPQLASIPIIVSTSDPSQAPAGALLVKKPINLDRMLETVRRLC